MDIRAAVEEHVAWVLYAAGDADTWAAVADHYGHRGVGVGPVGARVVAQTFCSWYAPHADEETRTWLQSVPEAVAAQVKPPSAMKSIFANARRTAKEVPWANITFERRVTVSCPTCGAAQDRARVFTCRYCDGDLFPRRPEDT